MTSKEDKALAMGRVCAAPRCERGGVSRIGELWVCNKHYQRHLHHGSFDSTPRPKPSRLTRCFTCNRDFDRGYAMNANRASSRQFCSKKCLAIYSEEMSIARAEQRFWAKVDVRGPDECWEWKGQKSSSGYGLFNWRRGRTQIASRIAYHFTKGDPRNLFVCHSCDNPPCVNPAHLWLGSQKENMNDAAAKGRLKGGKLRGEDHGCSKLSVEQARLAKFSGIPIKNLAREFGVTAQAIRLIRSGKNWAWL